MPVRSTIARFKNEFLRVLLIKNVYETNYVNIPPKNIDAEHDLRNNTSR